MTWRDNIQGILAVAFSSLWLLPMASSAQDRFTVLPAAPPPQDCSYWAGLQIPSTVCKRHAPMTRETRRHNFDSADFSWYCNSIGNLEFDFFNSSTRTVRTIIIEGATSGTRLTANVDVSPGQSKYVYVTSSGGFCAKERSARLYFNYQIAIGGECLTWYSTLELQSMRETCRAIQTEQQQRGIIYNNCFIEKSRGAEMTAINSIRMVCKEISENPSMLQRWRWGQ